MKSFCAYLTLLLLIFSFENSAKCQTRALGAGSLALDDNHGHTVFISIPTMTGPGPYFWTLPITAGGTALSLPSGTTNNSTLYWNGTTWTENTNFLAASTGALTATSISGLTTPLSAGQGGTGVATASANTFFAGPTSGLAAAPSFRALAQSDIAGIGVEYSPASTQNNATVGTSNYLFDVAYASTAEAQNALGARISSTNTSTGANNNATALTLNATATSSGTATGLAVNVSGGSSQNAATFTGGNVGIGTTAPITQLNIAGNVPASYLGSVSTGGSPYSVYVSGRYAYTANAGAATLGIFDISNPASPVSVGSVSTGASNAPFSVYVSGRYAYTANYNSFTLGIFDISNPASPVSVGSVSTGANSYPVSVYVSGRYAFVANYLNCTLGIFDISNPASPVSVGSVSTGTNSGPNSVYVSGRYAFTANSGTNKLGIFDISNPASPVSVGSVSTGSNSQPYSVYVSGRYAYTANYANNTLGIFDISNPASPMSVGSVSTGSNSQPFSVYVSGRYAYTANSNTNTLGIFDVSNPASPVSVGSVSTGANSHPYSVYASGRYAFVANNGNSTLTTFDLGGEYSQSLEAGSTETGQLQVRNDVQAGGEISARGGVTANTGNFSSGLSTGGSFEQASEQIAAGGTLDGRASIYNLTSGAATTTNAPATTMAQVIYVHNSTGNSQTIAGTSVTNGQTATVVYFPGSGWFVASVN